jgi:predicted esterase
VVVARNCNFSERNLEGWYPPEAIKTAIMVYYGENDPATIRSQSENAIRYLRSKGFQVETAEIPGVGHERHPEGNSGTRRQGFVLLLVRCGAA